MNQQPTEIVNLSYLVLAFLCTWETDVIYIISQTFLAIKSLSRVEFWKDIWKYKKICP